MPGHRRTDDGDSAFEEILEEVMDRPLVRARTNMQETIKPLTERVQQLSEQVNQLAKALERIEITLEAARQATPVDTAEGDSAIAALREQGKRQLAVVTRQWWLLIGVAATVGAVGIAVLMMLVRA